MAKSTESSKNTNSKQEVKISNELLIKLSNSFNKVALSCEGGSEGIYG